MDKFAVRGASIHSRNALKFIILIDWRVCTDFADNGDAAGGCARSCAS